MKKFKNESAFTRWFCEQLQAVNAITIAFVGSRMQGSNLPDRYVCHRDFRGWLEFKKDSGQLSTGQRIFMERLVKRGDTCFVIRYLSEFDTVNVETVNGKELYILKLTPGTGRTFLGLMKGL